MYRRRWTERTTGPSVLQSGDVGMWICLNATRGRDARDIYLLFLSLLFFCHVDVDADPTSLDHNDSAQNNVPSEVSPLPTSASDDFVECKNLTSDGLVGTFFFFIIYQNLKKNVIQNHKKLPTTFAFKNQSDWCFIANL